MNVNYTQRLKETGKWQQRSRMRIDLCLIVGCGLSMVGGASRVRVVPGRSPGCGLTCCLGFVRLTLPNYRSPLTLPSRVWRATKSPTTTIMATDGHQFNGRFPLADIFPDLISWQKLGKLSVGGLTKRLHYRTLFQSENLFFQ